MRWKTAASNMQCEKTTSMRASVDDSSGKLHAWRTLFSTNEICEGGGEENEPTESLEVVTVQHD